MIFSLYRERPKDSVGVRAPRYTNSHLNRLKSERGTRFQMMTIFLGLNIFKYSDYEEIIKSKKIYTYITKFVSLLIPITIRVSKLTKFKLNNLFSLIIKN